VRLAKDEPDSGFGIPLAKDEWDSGYVSRCSHGVAVGGSVLLHTYLLHVTPVHLCPHTAVLNTARNCSLNQSQQ
jgi:hypothetical protein